MPKDGQIIDLGSPEIKRLCIQFIKTAKGLFWWDVRRCREQRSLQQNKMMWGLVYPQIAAGMTEAWGEAIDSEAAHEFLKDKFLRKPVVNRNTGEIVGWREGSTAVLDKAEFSDYIEQIVKFAAQYLNVEVKMPEDL